MEVAYVERGRAKQEKHDPAGAASDYNQALRLNPRNAPALSYRGFANFDKGDAKAALADEDAQLRCVRMLRRPTWIAEQFALRQGELDQAESDFNKAIELNPKIASRLPLPRLPERS